MDNGINCAINGDFIRFSFDETKNMNSVQKLMNIITNTDYKLT